MIVVVDSGVWISGFHFGGTPMAAINSAYLHHRLALSPGILAEVRTTLLQKFLWKSESIDAAFAEFMVNSTLIEIKGTLHGICRDPKDDMVIECAITAGAGAIVSGDKDLLALKIYRGISILNPRDYLSFHSGDEA